MHPDHAPIKLDPIRPTDADRRYYELIMFIERRMLEAFLVRDPWWRPRPLDITV